MKNIQFDYGEEDDEEEPLQLEMNFNLDFWCFCYKFLLPGLIFKN